MDMPIETNRTTMTPQMSSDLRFAFSSLMKMFMC